MGNLVFQATLGGQVNLVGPNTASTFNLNVPAVSSTIATTSGTETLTNKTLTNPVINGFTGDTSVVNIGSGQFYKDTSGNIGIGVTPSAWGGAGVRAFQISGYGSLAGSVGSVDIYNNAYYDGSAFKYISSNPATRYSQNTSGSSHAWYNAASGTAGNAISFTQAMTLDASGNLGVGNTSPSAKLQVDATNFALANSYATLSSNFAVRTTTTSAANVGGEIALGGYNNGTSSPSDFVRLHGKKENGTAGNVSGYFAVEVAYDGGPAPYMFERMRIDSSGRLLYGITSPVNGACTYQQVTSVDVNQVQTLGNSSSSSPYLAYWYYGSVAPNNSGSYFLQCADSSTSRLFIRSNGGIANFQANNANLSDRREKTNFAPAGDYLAKICAIPVQTFNYIDQNLEEDDGLTLGVVAQDVQEVAPELVMESNWGTKEEPKMRLSIYQTDLQYALMKCIQEQQAIITQLTNRITALEQA